MIYPHPRQAVTTIRNIWEIMYPRKCVPSGEEQPASRWEGLEQKSWDSPLRRGEGPRRAKLSELICAQPSAQLLQSRPARRSRKYSPRPVPPHPALPGTLPAPALLHSSCLINVLNCPGGSGLLFCRHVTNRVIAGGTGTIRVQRWLPHALKPLSVG